MIRGTGVHQINRIARINHIASELAGAEIVAGWPGNLRKSRGRPAGGRAASRGGFYGRLLGADAEDLRAAEGDVGVEGEVLAGG